jgi:Ca-activated chloride channel family protein
MPILARVLLAIAVILLTNRTSAWAQAEERTIYASVLDRAGLPVTDLAATDFIVREDGVAREVLRALPATESLQIAVLVDTSQAVEPYISDIRNALRSFFKEMQGEHEIALFGFGERPTLLTDYTRDSTRLEAGVGRIFAQSGSGAYLLDAIVEVSRGLIGRKGVRPAIVVITTEGPEFSQRYYRNVLDELQAADVLLQSFVLTRRADASLRDEAAREREFTLANGATMTGGRREDLFTSMALAGRLQELAAELKSQYRVVYARTRSLIPPEMVDVDVKRPELTVRAPRVPRTARTSS